MIWALNTVLTFGVFCPTEYLGGAITCDAYHMTDPRADGLGVSTCIDLALKDSRIERDQVGVCVCNGTPLPAPLCCCAGLQSTAPGLWCLCSGKPVPRYRSFQVLL